MTPRKMRLMCCAAARTRFCVTDDAKFREAVALGEEWADTGSRPRGIEAIRRYLSKNAGPLDGAAVGVLCLAEKPDVSGTVPFPLAELRAAMYREQFGNPFVAPEWNPEWFTATVRGLAAHIYGAHEFSAMPILADALQDAGCDDQYVLHHCRASRPHARGCWVLDALLGKS
jgi:hypothetical protein